MIITPEVPNTIRIRFDNKKFKCNDENIEGRINPLAKPKFDEFMIELNKITKNTCINFPYYIYLFMIAYLASFIAIMYTGKYYLLFIPITFFSVFIIGIVWFSVSISRFSTNLNKVVDKYRVELSPYYTVVNQIVIYRGRYQSYSEQAIILSPVMIQMQPMPGNYYGPPIMYAPTNGIPTGANIIPQQGQYFTNNGTMNGQYMQPPIIQPNAMVSPIMFPTQPIPIYNFDPQNIENLTQLDIEDDPIISRSNVKAGK